MSDTHADTLRYECVDPELGDALWQLETPDVDPGLKQQLLDHLSICDACRLEQQFEQLVGDALRSGELSLPEESIHPAPSFADLAEHVMAPLRRLATGLFWGGAGLAAVSVLLVFLFSPTPPGGPRIARSGGAQAHFIRPLESEVVGSLSPELSWTPVEDATAYQLTLEAIRGSYRWMAETDETRATPPQKHALPANSRFRATIETVPRDLLPLGGMSVTFRTGGPLEYISYRMAAAPIALQVTAAGGGLIALVGLAWRVWIRHRQGAASI